METDRFVISYPIKIVRLSHHYLTEILYEIGRCITVKKMLLRDSAQIIDHCSIWFVDSAVALGNFIYFLVIAEMIKINWRFL